MNWLAWRQHRKHFLILGILLIIYAVIAIPMGLHFWHTYQHALSTCGQTNTCSQLSSELLQSGWDNNLNPSLPAGGFNMMMLLILAVPLLLGMFLGAPLIASEYTDNTNKLVWTQSVSRRKWLTVKLVWVLLASAVFAVIITGLTTWWSKTGNALNLARFNSVPFDMQGIVPVASAIFAVSLGIMLGAWFKRTLLAVAVTFGVLIAIMFIIVPNFVRPHYMTPSTYTYSLLDNSGNPNGDPLSPQAPPNSGASLLVSGNLVSKNGQPISWSNPPQSCIVTNPNGGLGANGPHSVEVAKGGPTRDALVSRNGGPTVDLNCLGELGYQWVAKYQPSYRYWDFQRIEATLYVVLSAIPIAGTYWLVLKRDA